MSTNLAHPLTLPTRATLAEQQSAANFAANARAIARSQPTLAPLLPDALPTVEWVFARDKALTALDSAGKWWSGCSVPARAATAMLKTLKPVGSVACFIEPPHAAHVRAVLAMTDRTYAIVCVVRDLANLRVILGCDDFSADVDSGRLWFAFGTSWTAELARIYDDHPGLPVPAQFIRVSVISEETATDVIKPGQRVFAETTNRRADAVRASHERPRAAKSQTPRICVAAALHFRLWNDVGHALADAMRADEASSADVVVLDVDDPRHAGALALAHAAESCDALVAADVVRTNLPGVIPPAVPWITWVTTPHVPAADPLASRDSVILADASWRDDAVAKGWRSEQIHVGGWPTIPAANDDATAGEGLAIIADTSSLEPPKDRMDFSSHAVLWEAIRDEILANPFAISDDVARYLDRRMAKLQISEEGFDRAFFLNALIVPAYQQALAGILIGAGLPLRLYGNHWPELPRFESHAAGSITDRDALLTAARSAKVLVHCWPASHHHPIDALGRPVLRRSGPVKESLLRTAREMLAGTLPPIRSASPFAGQALVRSILENLG